MRDQLTAHQQIDFFDLLDGLFLASPTSAGPLRDYWLTLEHRRGLGLVASGHKGGL